MFFHLYPLIAPHLSMVFRLTSTPFFSVQDYGLDLPGKKDIGVGIKNGNAYFAMTDSFSVDNLRSFVESWKKGELTPKIKEEPDHSEVMRFAHTHAHTSWTDL